MNLEAILVDYSKVLTQLISIQLNLNLTKSQFN